MSNPPPAATDLVTKAFANGIPMHAALKAAGVSRATWWRIRKGEDFRMSTITKIDEALNRLIADRP